MGVRGFILMSPSTLEVFREKLDALGEDEVRAKLLQRVWNSPRKEWASEWLEFQEKLKADAAATRAEHREQEAISIATEANKIARSASRWAMWAAIIALIAAIIAIKDQIIALIFNNP